MNTDPNSDIFCSPPVSVSRPIFEDLPFVVRLVRNEQDLQKIVLGRKQAYSRSHPTLADALSAPEYQDKAQGSILLAAFSKGTQREVLGSVRLSSNLWIPLEIEREIALPLEFANLPLLQVGRLSVQRGSYGQLVKSALFKGLYLYAAAHQLERIILAAAPPLDRIYNPLGFTDVFAGKKVRGLPSAAGSPVRIKSLILQNVRQYWKDIDCPLYDFVFSRIHRDIEVFSSVSNPWTGEKRVDLRSSTDAPTQQLRIAQQLN